MLTSYYEMEKLRKGNRFIAGADEVGRGAFAGPVVTGVVIFPPDFYPKWKEIQDSLSFRINDSKKLKAREREVASVWIQQNSYKWAVGEASVGEINKLGIIKATHKAYRRAIQKIGQIDQLLTDAFFIPRVKGIAKSRQLPLIRGDGLSVSIAAASIVAKVYRDQLMEKLGSQQEFSHYLWAQNKGYGTKAHRETITKFGITRYHRTKFIHQ